MLYKQAWHSANDGGKYEKSDLLAYFFNRKQSVGSLDEFCDQWSRVPHYDFNSKELSNILYKTAVVFRAPVDRNPAGTIKNFLASETGIPLWESCALRKVPSFNPQDLANTLWSMAALGIEPSDDFLGAWQQQTTDRMPTFNSQDLNNSLWSMASLGIAPSGHLLEAWEKQALSITSKFTPLHLSTSLWSLGIAELLSGDYDGQELASRLMNETHKYPAFEPSQIQQLKTAALWFDLPCSRDFPARTQSASTLEEDFHFFMKDNGYALQKNPYLDAFNHEADFSLTLKTSRKIIIETDGLYHFTRPVRSENVCCNFNGSTMMQSALFSKFYPEDVMLRLPSTDFKRIFQLSYDNMEKVAAELVSQAGKIKPGVHRVRYEDRRVSLETILSPVVAQNYGHSTPQQARAMAP